MTTQLLVKKFKV